MKNMQIFSDHQIPIGGIGEMELSIGCHRTKDGNGTEQGEGNNGTQENYIQY